MGLSRTQVASLCCYPGRLRIPLPMIPLFSAPSARVAVHLEESSLPVQFSFHIIIFLEFLFGHFCDFPTWRPFPSLSSSQHSGLFVTFGSIVSGLSIGCSVPALSSSCMSAPCPPAQQCLLLWATRCLFPVEVSHPTNSHPHPTSLGLSGVGQPYSHWLKLHLGGGYFHATLP